MILGNTEQLELSVRIVATRQWWLILNQTADSNVHFAAVMREIIFPLSAICAELNQQSKKWIIGAMRKRVALKPAVITVLADISWKKMTSLGAA